MSTQPSRSALQAAFVRTPHRRAVASSAEGFRNDRLFEATPLRELSQRSAQDLSRILRTTVHSPNTILFMEGEPARGVYILLRGMVKLSTTNSDGRTLILKIVQPGEFLGADSLLACRCQGVSAETTETCEIAFIAKDEFLRFMSEHADACLHLAGSLGRNCQHAYGAIRSIGLSNSVEEKLARFLLECIGEEKNDGRPLSASVILTREEIAQRIGCSRETVSRTLSRFHRDHLAELKRATLLIHDKAALVDLASR